MPTKAAPDPHTRPKDDDEGGEEIGVEGDVPRVMSCVVEAQTNGPSSSSSITSYGMSFIPFSVLVSRIAHNYMFTLQG